MKIWGLMLILLSLVAGLCIYDSINNNKVFNHMTMESEELFTLINTEDNVSIETLEKAKLLNTYWTKKMDTLCISISRKDLQPISDYIQYLVSSLENQTLEDAKTYSRLLNYNVAGIRESTGFTIINIL